MISPEEAKKIIRKNAVPSQKKEVPLTACFGAVLASDVSAPFPMPIADNSAMDGFVVRARDTRGASAVSPRWLKIAGTLKAGDSKRVQVSTKKTFRIMTGAFIPKGGDAVIPREEADVKGNFLGVRRTVSPGQHIRKCGEEIVKGKTLLRKGSTLDPAQIGLLAAFGYARVPVYKKPRVTVLATGSELTSPGKKLSAGKIYDSNSWMIRAALFQMGMEPLSFKVLRDDKLLVRTALRRALRDSDYLLLLGGVSVGDYDVVKEALRLEGVKTLFWKVNQKPGKPLYAGRKRKTIIFGLPGNPAAVFTCFYEYVYPALQKTLGKKNPDLDQVPAGVLGGAPRNFGRHLFLKAKIVSPNISRRLKARILPHQGSHMLSSLVEAQGFLSLPACGKKQSRKRDIRFHFFPGRVQK